MIHLHDWIRREMRQRPDGLGSRYAAGEAVRFR